MPVMNIGEMRVAVRERFVLMRMAMRLFAIPRKVMAMLVVCIVAVSVCMRPQHMGMRMRVRLRQMQPYAGAHQSCSHPKHRVRRFAQHH